MSLMNLATVFGPSLLRPPVAGLGHDGVPVDISQEVVVQVRFMLFFFGVFQLKIILNLCSRCRWFFGSCSVGTSRKLGHPCSPTQTLMMRPPTYERPPSQPPGRNPP